MDPVTIALSLLMKNPAAVGQMAQRATAPGQVDVARMSESVADMTREVLSCYHKTARMQNLELLQAPWSQQGMYGADNSMVMRIHYAGMTSARYQMVVAVMVKESKMRTAVLADNATVPYSKHCQLENWTGA